MAEIETHQIRMDLPESYDMKLLRLRKLTKRKRNQAFAVAIDIAIKQLETVPEEQRPAYINGIR